MNAVTEKDGAAYFDKSGVKILRRTVEIPHEQVLIQGERSTNGLFEVNLTGKTRESNFAESSNKYEEWHRKMGHLGWTNLKLLPHLARGVEFKEENIGSCIVCAMAKQTKKPHNTTRRRADRPMQVIHTDVCGPVNPATHDGKKYFVTCLDDFTHYTQVALMTSKSEASTHLRRFICEGETFHNLKTHKIRCDNGGEYTSEEFQDWCSTKGIVLDYTVPACPELNGKAERLNRVLVERARAMLFDSELPNYMWGEAIYSATYIINRSPTSTVPKLPAEMWFGLEQNLSNIQIFGTPVTAKILTHQKKFERRCRLVGMVGYGTNCYRLWDPTSKEIFVSRDVAFHSHPISDPGCSKENQRFWVEGIDENENLEVIEEINQNHDEEQRGMDEERQERLEQEQDAGNQEPPRYHFRNRDNLRRPPRFEDYEVFLSNCEDQTYQKCIDNPEWRKAIEEEKISLEKNSAWELRDMAEAEGKTIIDSRWILVTKPDGRKKARLVARGFLQDPESLEGKNIFSPVVDFTNLRVLFSLAAKNNMSFKTFDVKTAFLNGTIEDELFMEVPEGYNYPGKVCLLKKALYGLKEAPQRWYQKLSQALSSYGLQQLNNDKCIYRSKDCTLVLAIHVDDGIIFSQDQKEMDKLIGSLKSQFEITVNNHPKIYLGIQIEITNRGIFISQSSYVDQILKKFNMEKCNSAPTPMEARKKKQENQCDQSEQSVTSEPPSKFPYCQVVGSLQYLSCKTRPDIAFATNYASRFMAEPTSRNVTEVKRVLRYLQGTKDLGILFPTHSQQNLECYTDADFAGSGEAGKFKSTSGNVIYLGGGPISWLAKKQKTVASSSCEAEYISAAHCCKSILFIKSLVQELTSEDIPTTLYIDNQSALKLIQTGQMRTDTKHIQVKYHFISEAFDKGVFKLKYCPTDYNIADIFTKPLDSITKFINFRVQLCQTNQY